MESSDSGLNLRRREQEDPGVNLDTTTWCLELLVQWPSSTTTPAFVVVVMYVWWGEEGHVARWPKILGLVSRNPGEQPQ